MEDDLWGTESQADLPLFEAIRKRFVVVVVAVAVAVHTGLNLYVLCFSCCLLRCFW